MSPVFGNDELLTTNCIGYCVDALYLTLKTNSNLYTPGARVIKKEDGVMDRIKSKGNSGVISDWNENKSILD